MSSSKQLMRKLQEMNDERLTEKEKAGLQMKERPSQAERYPELLKGIYSTEDMQIIGEGESGNPLEGLRSKELSLSNLDEEKYRRKVEQLQQTMSTVQMYRPGGVYDAKHDVQEEILRMVAELTLTKSLGGMTLENMLKNVSTREVRTPDKSSGGGGRLKKWLSR